MTMGVKRVTWLCVSTSISKAMVQENGGLFPPGGDLVSALSEGVQVSLHLHSVGRLEYEIDVCSHVNTVSNSW